MLSGDDDEVILAIGRNHVRLVKGHTTFTSKLIDGRFPDYKAVIPVGADKQMLVDKATFIHALQRVAILSNEKYKGVRLEAAGSTIKIIAHNPQHEEAVEEIEAEFNFDRMAVGFNVTYLLDALMGRTGLRDGQELVRFARTYLASRSVDAPQAAEPAKYESTRRDIEYIDACQENGQRRQYRIDFEM